MQYKVKIRLLIAGPLGGELAAELPFTLTHPKPADTPPPTEKKMSAVAIANASATKNGGGDVVEEEAAEIDLIQFDS